MGNGREHKIFTFDGFRLDAEKMMLYSGEREITLPPKVIKTLAVLVEGQGEILSKSELIDAVWSGSIVEESNLSQYLYLLRKTLGKRPDGSPYIETLRRRGYRFTGEAVLAPGAQKKAPAPPKEVPVSSRHLDVERRGNVLALVDWKEADRSLEHSVPAPAPAPAAEQSKTSDRNWVNKAAMAALIALVAAVSAFAVYFSMSEASATSDSNGETSVTQLTSGIEVVDATISRDGKYFVYHERDGDVGRIWLQQTGHSNRVEIVPASTLIPSAKTFSPDGQFVYFYATDTSTEQSALYRVPTLGGPVTRVMTDVHSGVSFSPDGREMVFYRSDKAGANYVIAATDSSNAETTLHSTTPGFAYSAWSPDGRSIAIVLQAVPDDVAGGCYLAVVAQETGESKKISDEIWASCGRLEWAPDGHGLYMIGTRKGEGMTARRDQLFYISYPQGRSRKITADGPRYQYASLGVTSDGSVLVVPFNRSSQIWAMDPNGDSRTAVQITSGLNDGRSGIAPLADGRVAFISRIGENLNVWVTDQDGSRLEQLTDVSYPIEEVRSGGDGRYLIFSAYVDPDRPHLYRMNTDGTALQQLTEGENSEIDSSFSTDGKWIAYDSASNTANKFEFSIWKQSIESGDRVPLRIKDCQMPHFSPDDRYISCVRQQAEMLVLDSSDGTLVRSFKVPRSSTISHTLNFGARWTPDGSSLAYIVNERAVSNIWLQPLDGSQPKRLTDFTSGSIYHYAYSLGGTRLFLARGNQIRDAVLIKDK